jgi:dsDNA-binding SOS-regulon protein
MSRAPVAASTTFAIAVGLLHGTPGFVAGTLVLLIVLTLDAVFWWHALTVADRSVRWLVKSVPDEAHRERLTVLLTKARRDVLAARTASTGTDREKDSKAPSAEAAPGSGV